MRQNLLARLRQSIHSTIIVDFMRCYYNLLWGTHIGKNSRISLSVKIEKANPKGVVIGEYTAVAFGAVILTHDFVNNLIPRTVIGSYCLIGARAIVMPGVTIGDHCIIGSGAVVVRNVPPRSIVMGNPGRVIERGIDTTCFGIRLASRALQPDHQLLCARPEDSQARDRELVDADV
jgi:acetyltransferase-like isoleucine patch superfamily enzyme